MSADSYYVIKRHPLGGYTYALAFLPEGHGSIRIREEHPRFNTIDEAFLIASAKNAPHGVTFDEDIEPPDASGDFEAWFSHGIEQGWISEPVCATHNGLPTTEQEDEDFEDGYDHCILATRVWYLAQYQEEP